MDVLSEVLKCVTLRGAVFYHAEFSAPWSFRSPPSSVAASHIGVGAEHIVIYHLVAEGSAWARVGAGERVPLTAGDIVVFPHGDPHLMGNGRPVEPVDNERELERTFHQGLTVARSGGGGEVTRLVCGYLTCDPRLSRMVLGGLPALLKVNVRTDAAGVWLENSIYFSAAQAAASADGSEAVLARLSEALFVETLRRYVAALPAGLTGWLAGARDPGVGKALALIHSDPARAWTLAALASAAGVSRSVLAERFRHHLSEPPMSYLMRWRLQAAARLLAGNLHTAGEIAARCGYRSEAAFCRAFKREFGVPPARFRKAAA